MSDVKLTRIPLMIEASSVENLQKIMLLTNEANMRSFDYSFPEKMGAKWIAWYYADVMNHKPIKEKDLKELLDAGSEL